MKCKTDGCENVVFCKKMCKNCYNKQYYLDNKDELSIRNKKYQEDNKEKIAEINSQYYFDHKGEYDQYHKTYRANNKGKISEKKKIYYIENREKIIRDSLEYSARKLKDDPSFRLRLLISTTIRAALKRVNFSKNGETFTKYLPYSIQQLQEHLEKQFESWMTWDNWGIYNIDIWDDNDQTTWTWQIDHIIPQSIFLYSSMADNNFQKCWALENLRPLSAKQNLLKSNSFIEADSK